jgi:hypothetical protein
MMEKLAFIDKLTMKPAKARYAVLLRLLAVSLWLTSAPVTTFAQRSKPYVEDLSVYRPKFELANDTVKKIQPQKTTSGIRPKATKNVNAKLDALLDSIDKQNLQKKFIEGFTIQIYSGQNKAEAMTTKQKVIEELSNLTATLQYVQPKFRVCVGSYFSKLEAQKDLVKLKSYFPSAILVPDKFQIR